MDEMKNPYGIYFDTYCLHCDNKICFEQLTDTANYTDYQKKIVSDCATMKDLVNKFLNKS